MNRLLGYADERQRWTFQELRPRGTYFRFSLTHAPDTACRRRLENRRRSKAVLGREQRMLLSVPIDDTKVWKVGRSQASWMPRATSTLMRAAQITPDGQFTAAFRGPRSSGQLASMGYILGTEDVSDKDVLQRLIIEELSRLITTTIPTTTTELQSSIKLLEAAGFKLPRVVVRPTLRHRRTARHSSATR